MINEEIKIPTDGRPIEAFVMRKEPKPGKAFLILPGKGYTINHFLIDFLWRMAAEEGFYSLKAEYRGYTYRHLQDEPYDHEHAAKDAEIVVKHLQKKGFAAEDIVVCGKSLGSIAVGTLVMADNYPFRKTILLTPVLYLNKGDGPFPSWQGYMKRSKDTLLVFGSNDEFCDLTSAKEAFPGALIEYVEGADHGLLLPEDYAATIELKMSIIEKVKQFILA